MKYLRLSISLGLAAVTSVLFGSCAGYQLGPIKPTTMAGIHSLAVPTFKNETLEPRIQSLVTNSVIRQLQADGSYTVASESKADATVLGTIKTIERRQLRGVRTDVLRTREMEVTVTLDYVVRNLSTGVEVAKGTVRGRTDIFLDPNFQLSERQAVQKAAETAAINLVNAISEGF